MITEKLQNLLATHLTSLVNNGKVGLGGNSTYGSQTDLDVPLVAATSVSATQSDANVVQVKITMNGSSASMTGQVIREVGVLIQVLICYLEKTLRELAHFLLMTH